MIEIEELRRFIEGEKSKNHALESDLQRLTTKINIQQDQLKSEKERLDQKDCAIQDLVKQREIMQQEHDHHIAQRKVEFDNLKRAFDELHYESETLRKTVNQKQEEISGLNRTIN